MKKVLFTKPRNLMKAPRKPKKPTIKDVFEIKTLSKKMKNNKRRSRY